MWCSFWSSSEVHRVVSSRLVPESCLGMLTSVGRIESIARSRFGYFSIPACFSSKVGQPGTSRRFHQPSSRARRSFTICSETLLDLTTVECMWLAVFHLWSSTELGRNSRSIAGRPCAANVDLTRSATVRCCRPIWNTLAASGAWNRIVRADVRLRAVQHDWSVTAMLGAARPCEASSARSCRAFGCSATRSTPLRGSWVPRWQCCGGQPRMGGRGLAGQGRLVFAELQSASRSPPCPTCRSRGSGGGGGSPMRLHSAGRRPTALAHPRRVMRGAADGQVGAGHAPPASGQRSFASRSPRCVTARVSDRHVCPTGHSAWSGRCVLSRYQRVVFQARRVL